MGDGVRPELSLRVSSALKRLVASRSAAAAAEFALLVPLLATILFGTFQIGLLMWSYNQMVSAARDTTRSMAVCSVTNTMTAASNTLPLLPPWISAASWTITPVIGAPDVSTTISVDASQAMILNFVPIALGPITASVTMTKEPLAFSSVPC